MRRATVLAIITPTLVGVFIFSLEMLNANRVLHGMRVGDLALGGTHTAEAQEMLAQRVGAFLASPVAFRNAGIDATRTPQELGVTIDLNQTFARAWERGRQGYMLAALYAHVATFFQQQPAVPVIGFDETLFEETLSDVFASIDDPARDATLTWDTKKKTFVRTQERYGRIVNRAPIRAALLASATSLTAPQNALPLALIDDNPIATVEDLPAAQTRVNDILARAPFTLTAGDITQQLTRETLGPWFVFLARPGNTGYRLEVALNEKTVRTFLDTTLAPKVNRDAINAQFRFDKGRVTAFALARNGQTIDIDGSMQALRQSILTETANETTPILLPVTITKPEIGNDAAETLGIRELISVGETDFSGSPKNRIHNIKTGTARFNGALIKPGEEFSFNALLGAVGPETGYKPELVIKQGKTTPEYGGGLCQVSTTAFRAAVIAGLEITERRNHAYIVRYYNPAGFDATIYPPHPDLRFVNNTPGHILIQTSVTGTKVRFEFYGTSDDRKVDILGPYVYDKKADGSAKATLTMKVTAVDGTIREQTFRSVYKSPALYPVERRNPLE